MLEIGGVFYASAAHAAVEEGTEVVEEAVSTPAGYWIHWVLVVLILLFMITYVSRARKKRMLYEGLAFACIVSVLTLIAFAIMMSEPVTEYAKYHESAVVTIIRFFILLITAGFLVYYAVRGRHEHKGENVNV